MCTAASYYAHHLALRPYCSHALQRWSVPKSWFTVFYIVGLALAAALLAAIASEHAAPCHAVGHWSGTATGNGGSALPSRSAALHQWLQCVAANIVTEGRAGDALLMSVFGLHALRRLLECMCVHRFSASARMPVHLWLAGVGHYVLTPFALLRPVGGIAASAGEHASWATTGMSGESSAIVAGFVRSLPLTLWCGITAVAGASVLQCIAHLQLASLRSRHGPISASGTNASSRSSSDTGVSNPDDSIANLANDSGGDVSPASTQSPSLLHRRGRTPTRRLGTNSLPPDTPPTTPSLRVQQTLSRRAASGMSAGHGDGSPAIAVSPSPATSVAPGTASPAATAGVAASGMRSSAGSAGGFAPTPPASSAHPAPAENEPAADYSVPNVGLFQYAWCPHYAAEIAIYAGLLLIAVSLGHVAAWPGASSSGNSWASIETNSGPLLLPRFQAALPPGASRVAAFVEHAVVQAAAAAQYNAALLFVWVCCNLSATAARTRGWYLSLPSVQSDPAARAKPALFPGLL